MRVCFFFPAFIDKVKDPAYFRQSGTFDSIDPIDGFKTKYRENKTNNKQPKKKHRPRFEVLFKGRDPNVDLCPFLWDTSEAVVGQKETRSQL